MRKEQRRWIDVPAMRGLDIAGIKMSLQPPALEKDIHLWEDGTVDTFFNYRVRRLRWNLSTNLSGNTRGLKREIPR